VPLQYIPVPNKYCPIRKKNNMIWHSTLSTFLLNRVYELVTEEKPGLPLFRNCDLKATVEAILKYTSSKVGVAQVYNHPRHWRSRWVHVCRLNKEDGGRALGGEDVSYHDRR
jgi:hypothetical protein